LVNWVARLNLVFYAIEPTINMQLKARYGYMMGQLRGIPRVSERKTCAFVVEGILASEERFLRLHMT